MKDVIDAVIEFEGEWPYHANNMVVCIDSYCMYNEGSFESYTCDEYSGLNTLNWMALCNREQFNACIDELSTNFGTSCTYAEYKKQQENKVGIDWSKSPSNCDGYSVSSCMIGYWHLDNEMLIAAPDFGIKECKFFHRPPPTNPIYTQSMKDEGVLPSVGMECLIFNGELMNPTYEKSTIDFIGCHVIVYSSESCTERTCNLELVKFKPLTLPIELIDGKAYQFELNGYNRAGVACRGMLITVGMSSKQAFHAKPSDCTNIKELEVKL